MADAPLDFTVWTPEVLQRIAINLNNEDVRSLRLTCKSFAAAIDASYLLNIPLLLSANYTFNSGYNILFPKKLFVQFEAQARSMDFARQHRYERVMMDITTEFQPWIKAIERFKNSNIKLQTNFKGERNLPAPTDPISSDEISLRIKDYYNDNIVVVEKIVGEDEDEDADDDEGDVKEILFYGEQYKLGLKRLYQFKVPGLKYASHVDAHARFKFKLRYSNQLDTDSEEEDE